MKDLEAFNRYLRYHMGGKVWWNPYAIEKYARTAEHPADTTEPRNHTNSDAWPVVSLFLRAKPSEWSRLTHG